MLQAHTCSIQTSRMSDESKSLTKWQLALLIGAGAVAVAGGAALCYGYINLRKPSSRLVDGSLPSAGSRIVSTTQTTSENEPTPSTGSGATSTVKSTLEQARAIKQQGNEFYKQQKFTEAIKCYEEAIRVCPPEKSEDIAMFYQNIAAAYDSLASRATDEDEKTSHTHAILEYCNKALALNNRYIKALTRRLKVHEALGNKKEALLDVTRVLLLDDTQARTLSQMVPNLLKDVGKDQATQNFPKLGPLAPTKHLVKTYFDSFLWNDDLSEERLKELWSSRVTPSSKTNQSESTTESHDDTNDNEPQVNGESDTAPPSMDQSEAQEMSHDPFEGYSDEPFIRAVEMFQSSKYNGIIEQLTEAVENGNAVFVPHALLLRGSMFALFRQDSSALKDFLAVINTKDLLDQMYISALIRKAGIFAGEGEMEKCKTCFDKAFAIDQKSGDAFIHRARLNLETEDLQLMPSVISDLEAAIAIAPNSPYAAFSLASSYHRLAGLNQSMQILETAQRKFQEAMQKFPTYADGLVLNALFLQDLSQFEEAENILNKAVKLEPDNPLCHYSLGLLNLVFTHDMAKATSYLETAISVDNSCVQAYDTLASLEMQKGNKARAMDLYDRGIQFARTKAEMAQAYIAKDVVVSQDQACQEFGISMQELASKVMPSTLQ